MSYFYVLPFGVRLLGLTTALSMKYAQVCLFIILDDHRSGVNFLRSLIRLLENFKLMISKFVIFQFYIPILIFYSNSNSICLL